MYPLCQPERLISEHSQVIRVNINLVPCLKQLGFVFVSDMQSIEGLSSCLFVWDKMSKNNLRIVFEDT